MEKDRRTDKQRDGKGWKDRQIERWGGNKEYLYITIRPHLCNNTYSIR